jgi:hypothetical protein
MLCLFGLLHIHSSYFSLAPLRQIRAAHIMGLLVYRCEPWKAPVPRTSPAPWAGFLVSLYEWDRSDF